MLLLRLTSGGIVRENKILGLFGAVHLIVAYSLFAITFDFYRATRPGVSFDNPQWIWITVSYILIVFLIEALIESRAGNVEGTVVFALSVIVVILVASFLDRLNEHFAMIPLSWGAFGIGVIAFFAFSRRRS